MSFQNSMTFFLLRNIKEDILKNDDNQTFLVTTSISWMEKKKTTETFLKNIFFYVPQTTFIQVWNDDEKKL